MPLYNPYAKVFKNTLGTISLDVRGHGGENMSMGNGYTMDLETGELGREIAPGFSKDFE